MSTDKDIKGTLISANEEAIEVPAGMDRRAFLMRSAPIGSMAVITDSAVARAAGNISPPPRPQLAQLPNQSVVKQNEDPVLTTVGDHGGRCGRLSGALLRTGQIGRT